MGKGPHRTAESVGRPGVRSAGTVANGRLPPRGIDSWGAKEASVGWIRDSEPWASDSTTKASAGAGATSLSIEFAIAPGLTTEHFVFPGGPLETDVEEAWTD
jgi:hypothetical protein